MDDWAEVKAAVADALELEAAEREAFLGALDRSAPELAPRVRQLVGAASSASAPEAPLPPIGLGSPALDWTSEVLGGYRIRRFIARGGMGEVFEAEQAGTGRRVALKVLARGARGDRSRFQQEGRLLGQLSHPNIASVLDADVHRAADGSRWPYLALELVEGERITDHVRQAGLDRQQILRLFCDVCRGVEHAHRKGIVHRDLKPDNILVAPAPEGEEGPGLAKILDFGIAALHAEAADDPATRLTRDGDLIGTLAYMAPEQVDGAQARVDVRTDVYGLGVVLFELLTGRLPFDLTGRTLTESLQLLRSGHARPPSAFDRSLRGDLDTIVATALAPERERRYPSAQALARDVERFLAHQPIAARPAGRLYRAAKFVQRHRTLVASTALAGGLLVAGIVGTSIGLGRARAEVAHSRDVNAFLGEILASPSPEAMGGEVTLRQVLDRYAPQIDERFPDHPLTRAQLHARVGWAYFELGEAQPALHHLERTHALVAAELGPRHAESLSAERELQHAKERFGVEWPGAVDEARELHERTCAILGPQSMPGLLAGMHYGSVLTYAGRFDQARQVLAETVALAREAPEQLGAEHWETLLNVQATTLNQLALHEEALAIFEELDRLRVGDAGLESAPALRNRANIVSALGELGRYEEALEACLALQEPVLRVFGAGSLEAAQQDHSMGVIHMGFGEFEQAAERFDAALELYEARLGPVHQDTLRALNNLAVCQAYRDRWDLCEPLLRTLIERTDGLEHDGGAGLNARGLRAIALTREGRYEEARAQTEELIEVYAALYGPDHNRTLIERNNLARLLHTELDAPAEGAAILEQVVAGWRRGFPEEFGTLRTLVWNLGRAQADAGQFEAAERSLLEVEALGDDDPAQGIEPAAWRARMHELYVAWGRPDRAADFEPPTAEIGQ